MSVAFGYLVAGIVGRERLTDDRVGARAGVRPHDS